jgi:hypothetical protein
VDTYDLDTSNYGAVPKAGEQSLDSLASVDDTLLEEMVPCSMVRHCDNMLLIEELDRNMQ